MFNILSVRFSEVLCRPSRGHAVSSWVRWYTRTHTLCTHDTLPHGHTYTHPCTNVCIQVYVGSTGPYDPDGWRGGAGGDVLVVVAD